MDEHRIIRCCLCVYAVKTEAPETVLYTPDDLKDTPSMHDGSSGEWGIYTSDHPAYTWRRGHLKKKK